MTVHLGCLENPAPAGPSGKFPPAGGRACCTFRMGSVSIKWLIYMAKSARRERSEKAFAVRNSAAGEAAGGTENQGCPHLFSPKALPGGRCALCIAFTRLRQVLLLRLLTFRVPPVDGRLDWVLRTRFPGPVSTPSRCRAPVKRRAMRAAAY